jgi:hypothetical protein
MRGAGIVRFRLNAQAGRLLVACAPVKKAVRAAERLEAGDQVKAQLQIADL